MAPKGKAPRGRTRPLTDSERVERLLRRRGPMREADLLAELAPHRPGLLGEAALRMALIIGRVELVDLLDGRQVRLREDRAP